jgi:hypothetical protein
LSVGWFSANIPTICNAIYNDAPAPFAINCHLTAPLTLPSPFRREAKSLFDFTLATPRKATEYFPRALTTIIGRFKPARKSERTMT